MSRTPRFLSFLLLTAAIILATSQAGSAQQFAGGERVDPMATSAGVMRVVNAFQENAAPACFAISGAVNKPGVYSSANGRLTLQQLIEAAGGLRAEASPALRVLRNGRARLRLFYDPQNPGSEVPLFPGDVIVAVSEGPAEAEPKSIPVICLGLMSRPVFLPLNPRIQTLPDLVDELWQPATLAESTTVLDPSGRGDATQLTSGMIIVFDPAKIDRHRLSQTNPFPEAIPVETSVQPTSGAVPAEPASREESDRALPLFEDEPRTTAQQIVPPAPDEEQGEPASKAITHGELPPLPPRNEVNTLPVAEAPVSAASKNLDVPPAPEVQTAAVPPIAEAAAVEESIPSQENWLSSPAAASEMASDDTAMRDSSSPSLAVLEVEEPAPAPGVRIVAEQPDMVASESIIRRAEGLHPAVLDGNLAESGVDQMPQTPQMFSRDSVQYFSPSTPMVTREQLESYRDARRASALPEPATLAGAVASHGIAPTPAQTFQSARAASSTMAPPPPVEPATTELDRILQARKARQSAATAADEPVSVRGVLPVVFGAGLLILACFGISVLWTKIEANEGDHKQVADGDSASATGQISPMATAQNAGIQQLLSRSLPVIEEQILVPRERLLYGKVVGHQRIVLHSAHEAIEGPHYARPSRTRNSAAATMSAALDEQTLRQSLRDGIEPTGNSFEVGLEHAGGSAKPPAPRSVEIDLSEDSAQVTAQPVTSKGSQASQEIPSPKMSQTPVTPPKQVRKSTPVAASVADEAYDIVQPEFHPAQKTPQSPLERALRTLSSEKRG